MNPDQKEQLELVPPASSRPRPSLPPDKEGDEELLERRGRMRHGWRSA